MSGQKQINRRTILKSGFAAIASAGILTADGHARKPEEIGKKKPGETKAVYLGGDVLHNFMAQDRTTGTRESPGTTPPR